MVDYCIFFVVLLSVIGFSKFRLEGMGWILYIYKLNLDLYVLGLYVILVIKLIYVNF